MHELSLDHAVVMLAPTPLDEGVHAVGDIRPVGHGEDGSTPKLTTVREMLNWLGIARPYTRTQVSQDSQHIDSLFKTAKHRPQFPARGIKCRKDARHAGEDLATLQARHALYQKARQKNPARW